MSAAHVQRRGARLLGVTVACIAAVFPVGCDSGKGKDDLPPPPTSRYADAVVAKDAGAQATAAATHAVAPVSGPARQICVGQSARSAPKGTLKTAAAAGAETPPTPLPFGVGKWVWVNLWAAWCGPCKEEMPRLHAWQTKLAGSGVQLDLAFISLDDDPRQLERFLEAQPKGGVRASYWLPEGETRTGWLSALGVKETPDLPMQALVSPQGQVACIIQGAVEDRDYPAVAAFLRAGR